MAENPYTAPQASPELAPTPGVQLPTVLASRWARLGASIIDSIIVSVLFVPLLMVIFAFGLVPGLEDTGSFVTNMQLSTDTLIGNVVTAVLGMAIYLLIQGYLLVNSGQSIGKKALGIQIVDQDSQQLLPAGRVLGIRYIVTSLLYQVPFVGQFFALIDVLFIFGAEKQCLHDMMAHSIVIKK
ncbi:hypothetical protein NT6N_18620 [Oceaniferula spumae]|uniref:RDD domain-containing protein n=1 Tax=Oceaniferula spumae TaxID=2979115 RepID=A0AAT9FLJ6_9BACT